MDFKTVATLGALASAPFGVMFLLLPAQAGALYGHVAPDAYTLFMGRLFGLNLLLFTGALWGVRAVRDPDARRSVAATLACLTALATVLTAWGVLSGAVNAMGWSSVAVYGFFILAWGRLALRGGEAGPAA